MIGAGRQSLHLANPAGVARTASAKTITLGLDNSYNTSVKKFGDYSLRVGGGYDGTPTEYRHSYSEASTDFNFGTGDFTVECWFYGTETSTADLRLILAYNDLFSNNTTPSGSSGSWIAWAAQILPELNGTYWFYPSGGSVGAISHAGSVSWSNNTWVHLAFCRSGTTFRSFINGAVAGTTTGHSVDYTQTGSGSSATPRIWMGGTPDSTETRFGGYLDDIRITKGEALYTSAFTPSATALTNTAGTVLLWHMENAATDDNVS